MAKNLIIVESPAKARTISKFLKNKFVVKASMGHIRDLPTRTLGVDVENNFEPEYVEDSKKKKVISELREAAKSADKIFLASDHDREGEAIAWHLSKILEKDIKNKELYRIVFNEITQKAIDESLKNPGKIDMAKVDAQQARRILDRIVGYSISPLLWKVIAKDLSAGRVQSVALRLICEREDEITAFVPKEYWNIDSEFWRDDLPKFKASLERYQGKKKKLESQEDTDAVLEAISGKEALLKEIKRTNRNVQPQAPFITSTLQQEASKLLSFQAQRTMSIAQQLYEGVELGGESTGLITYMRTDSTRVTPEANAACKSLVKERFGEEYVYSSMRFYKNKQSAQDAHEAIRPTDPFRTPESLEPYLTKEQLRLYTLIWQRFVATQMTAAKLLVTKASIEVGEAEFSATGNQISFDGFMKCYPHVHIPLGETIHQDYAKADTLEYMKPKKTQHFTKPPSRFTEAALIKELEAKGIGRPSTYASIISTIRNRKYVVIEKRSFIPTPLGMDVNRFLVDKFDSLFNVKFTAEMEDKLDEVEYGKQLWHNLLKQYYDDMNLLIGKVDVKKEKEAMTEETDIICDKCNEAKMVVRRGRSGEFLACSAYPKCRNSKNFKRDLNGNIVVIVPEVLDEKCPQCGKDLIEKNGRFGTFIACTGYPACKYARPKTLDMKCPECKTGDVAVRKNKRGNTFYSCTEYPECKWISNYKPVNQKCPNCGNHYMQERFTKTRGHYIECPKCKHILE